MGCVGQDRRDYAALKARVFAISVDSPHVNARFAAETGADFPVLSDFNRDAIRAYDVVRPDLGGLRDVAERTVFVIDADGIIRYAWQGEHPGVMPPFDEIKAVLASLA
jgi:peroxiredoxin